MRATKKNDRILKRCACGSKVGLEFRLNVHQLFEFDSRCGRPNFKKIYREKREAAPEYSAPNQSHEKKN